MGEGFRPGLLIGGLAVAVIGLIVALVLTSWGDGNGGATTATTEAAAPTEVAPPTEATVTTPAGDAVEFRTPTGNIVCRVTNERARCGIREFSYTPPPEPADCGLPGWGQVLEVGVTGPGDFVCSDEAPAATNAPILGYGRNLSLGQFACGSSRIGAVCTNRETGHGFALSRERFGRQ